MVEVMAFMEALFIAGTVEVAVGLKFMPRAGGDGGLKIKKVLMVKPNRTFEVLFIKTEVSSSILKRS